MGKEIIPAAQIAQAIHFFRGQKVLFDFDLAALYEGPTGQLNSAVKRHEERFPPDFMFRLSAKKAQRLKCQIGISKAELQTRVDRHDDEIAAIIEAIRQLIAPPAKPIRAMGFHVRETPPHYGTRKRP
jgi:hypothetical protein